MWDTWKENGLGPYDVAEYMPIGLVALSAIFGPGCGVYGLKGKCVPCLAN